MVVTAGDELRTRSFPGTVEASRRVELGFQVPGLLVKLPVREGQQVAKGGVIAELRQDEFRARLEALRGQLGRPRRGHPGCGGRGARARGPRGRSEPSARGHDAPCAIRRYHRGGRLRTSSRRCGFGAGSSAGGRRCGASGTWSPRRATCAASSRSGSRRHDAIARRFPLPSLQCRARTSCAAPALLAGIPVARASNATHSRPPPSQDVVLGRSPRQAAAHLAIRPRPRRIASGHSFE